MTWNKGPTHKLKEGFARFELTYRVNNGDGWEPPQKMWATKPVGSEKELGRDLYARLARYPQPFEIISIRALDDSCTGTSGSAAESFGRHSWLSA